MNHIYRIVWNHATACYQAVTESATGQGKKANTAKKSNLASVKASLNFSLLVTAFFSIFTGLASATPVILIGDYVKTAVSDYGTLGSNGNASPGILFDLSGTRTFGVDDYLTPGTPFQFFSIKTNETGQLSNNNSGVLQISTVAGPTNLSTSTTAKASWSGAVAGKYTVTNTYSVDVNKKNINIDTFITATSNLTGVKFVTAIDPDPDYNTYGNFNTVNGRGTSLIPAKDLVYAKGSTSGLPIGIYSNSTITHNTGVSGGWTYDPDFYLLGNNDGNGDYAIGMAFDIGSLLLGDSVHITYFYTTGGSVEAIELPIFTNINTAVAFYNANNLGINVNPVFEGGTIKVDAPITYAQNFTINSQGGTIDANGKAATFSGVFSDTTTGVPGALTITDSATGGVVTLTGVNTYTGATTIAGGTLALAGSGSIASSSGVNLSAAGAKFDVSGVTSKATTIQDLSGVAGTTVAMGNTVLTAGTANSTAFAGEFTGNGGLNKVSSGTLTLTGTNTAYTGATTIAGGTLALAGSGSIAASSGVNLSATGAKFDVSGVTSKATAIQDFSGVAGTTVNTGATVLTAGTANSTTFAGEITGSGGLNKVGSGTLTLAGANTANTGATTVAGGTLALAGSGSIAASSGVNLSAAGAKFDVSGVTSKATTIQDLSGVAGTTVAMGNTVLTAGTANSTTFAGEFTGSGGLNKVGSGTLTLVGANTAYTGATTVAGGTLALAGSGSIAASSGVNLSATGAKFDVSGITIKATTIQDLSGVAGTTVNTGATVLTVGTANSTTFSGEITGSGGLNKVGSGTLTLAGANTAYTGATTVAGGTLALEGSGSVAASSGVNLSAAGAKFDVSGVTSKATTIQDFSGVAGTTVNTGATVLTVGTANSTTFAGELTGSGGVNKVGSGTLDITGNSAAFTGQNTVNGGHLKVNGYLGGSSLDVSSGSLLSGSGTVGGQTTIRSGGTISPGNSIGTLSVAGGFTQEGGSNYEVQVDPSNTASDRIAVSGSANLASGAQLHVSRTSGQNYVLETKYTVLSASGGVNGKYTLSGDTAVSAFYNLQDQYDANNVYLTVAQTTPFQNAGETRNQIASGAGLQSTPNGSKLHNLIGNMQDFATARGAFDQMSGEIYASMAGARMSDASEVRQAATNRMRSAFCADSGPTTTSAPAATSADAAAVQACQVNPEKAARWTQVLGTRATTKGDGNAAALDHNGAGLVIGADMKVGDATRAGIFFNAKNSTYSVNDRLSSAKQQDVGVGIFASGKALESVNMDYRVGGTYTQHDVTASRRVNFKGLDESLKGSFKANTTQIFGEIGSRVALSSDFMIEPFANLAFVRNDQKAFDEQPVAESTALSALHSVKKSQDMAFTTIGVRAAADYAVGNAKLSVRGMVGLRSVIGKNVPLSTHQFTQSDEFTVAGVPVAKNLLVTEVGVGYDINDQVSMGVSYTGQYASGSHNQGLKATLEIKF